METAHLTNSDSVKVVLGGINSWQKKLFDTFKILKHLFYNVVQCLTLFV